jgi:hypothetical protein
MPLEYEEALLQEYQQCDEQVRHLDNLTWTTASVIFPINLAGLSYVALATTHTVNRFAVVGGIALGSTVLLGAWYFLSRAWYSYQSIAFYRMREIEVELELWHYRYSLFLRQSKEERQAILESAGKSDKARLERLDHQVDEFVLVGLRTATKIITLLFVLAWIGLVVHEGFLTF